MQQANFRVEPDILEGLEFVKARDGVPISEQVRRALRAWLASKDVPGKSASRRAHTRQKA